MFSFSWTVGFNDNDQYSPNKLKQTFCFPFYVVYFLKKDHTLFIFLKIFKSLFKPNWQHMSGSKISNVPRKWPHLKREGIHICQALLFHLLKDSNLGFHVWIWETTALSSVHVELRWGNGTAYHAYLVLSQMLSAKACCCYLMCSQCFSPSLKNMSVTWWNEY